MAQSLGIEVPPAVLRDVAELDASPAILHVPAQEFTAGWSGAGFAFDNELQSLPVSLRAFDIDAQPVSWDHFLEFVRAGGYRERRWWDEAGWRWLQVC